MPGRDQSLFFSSPWEGNKALGEFWESWTHPGNATAGIAPGNVTAGIAPGNPGASISKLGIFSFLSLGILLPIPAQTLLCPVASPPSQEFHPQLTPQGFGMDLGGFIPHSQVYPSAGNSRFFQVHPVLPDPLHLLQRVLHAGGAAEPDAPACPAPGGAQQPLLLVRDSPVTPGIPQEYPRNSPGIFQEFPQEKLLQSPGQILLGGAGKLN